MLKRIKNTNILVHSYEDAVKFYTEKFYLPFHISYIGIRRQSVPKKPRPFLFCRFDGFPRGQKKTGIGVEIHPKFFCRGTRRKCRGRKYFYLSMTGLHAIYEPAYTSERKSSEEWGGSSRPVNVCENLL